MVVTVTRHLFSILLPTHNRADVLLYSIKSVQAQTYPRWELLVVGDGCTDGTDKLMQKVIKADKRIKWYPYPKGEGFGYGNRNLALEQARGEYCAFAAHDDIWFPDHLSTFVKYFTDHPDDKIAYTRPLWIHPDGTLVPTAFNTNFDAIKQLFLHDHNEIPAHSVVYPLGLSKKVGGWSTKIKSAGDWELWKQIVNADPKAKIGFIPYPTAVHFRAKWRRGKSSWSPHTQAMYELSSIKVTADDDMRLHRRILQLSQQPEWVEKIREQVVASLDGALYESPAGEIARLKSDLERITSTRGYRWLEQMRKLKKLTGEVAN